MIRAQEIELDLASERGRCAMADEIADVVGANGASALRGQNPLLNVSVGSNSEELSTSICFPLCPRTRTLLDAGGTSHLCHEQTCGAIRSSDQYGRGFRHTQASAAKAAGCSRTRNEQRLHVCAAGHSGIRRLEVLALFSLLDEPARNNKGVLQAFSLPECDVEKGVAEI